MSALKLRGGTLSPRSHRLNKTYRLLCSTEDSKSFCLMSFPFLLFLWHVSHPPLANQTSAVEAKQIAQHKAQVTPRGQQTSPGKISTEPQNMDTALSFPRSALKLPKTTRARPPPEPPPPEDRIAEPDPDIKTQTTDSHYRPPLTGHSLWTSTLSAPWMSPTPPRPPPEPPPLWPVSNPSLANQTSTVEAKQIAQHKAQVTPRGSNLVEVESNAEWTLPAPQPSGVPTLDAATPATKPTPAPDGVATRTQLEVNKLSQASIVAASWIRPRHPLTWTLTRWLGPKHHLGLCIHHRAGTSITPGRTKDD